MKKVMLSIAQKEDALHGVLLARRGGEYELLARERSADVAGWDSLKDELAEQGGSAAGDSVSTVLGYESGGVAYYYFTVPAVRGDELENIILMQAESLLPLPLEEMNISWQVGREHQGKLTVSLVAIRRVQLTRFESVMRSCKPDHVLLENEAIINAARAFYLDTISDGVIVYQKEQQSKVCVVEQGRMVLAVTSDVGRTKLYSESALQELHAERLVQDLRHVLGRLESTESPAKTVYVLSDGERATDDLVAYLERAGLDAQVVKPSGVVTYQDEHLSGAELYDLLIPLGLALVSESSKVLSHDLFDGLGVDESELNKGMRIPSLRVSAILFLVIGVLYTCVAYAVDSSRYEAVQQRILDIEESYDISKMEKAEDLKKAIAEDRVNMLEVMTCVTDCMPKGELVDSVGFVRKKPVSVSGKTKNMSRSSLFELQESLQKKKHVSQVRLQNARPDSKGKQLSYTVTFDYKDWTKK